ncbi:murein hydrolase activator EnvC family protein [Noviherbaspirillum suwonense]|uniref:Septal ring factor EnvC, activator of murein hydrolases AmiA and AmiB n=1 Tax=Noviherbaspirillum suwonense TaxID=1224511 RepID=A0ABY1QM05_9BURK|nr:peptidoglycan DD-metalloendopeptidase family protein [Noviherbaspirillum suwonense]SMP73334.1 Septal ring factor EnvC, activator of murein hydrolases AmiA and AmiB [Noviherbaspirillum suwonense]
MIRERWRRGAVLALALLLAAGAAPAAKVTERTRQKQAAEAERAALQQKLTALKRAINQTESAKDDAADALAESEAAISDANRALYDLAREQKETAARVGRLQKELAQLTREVDAQKERLSRLLRQQYVAGNEDRLKLLLSGDNPNRINRDLQYFGYVSQAQAKLIEMLRADMAAVERNRADTQDAKDELDEIALEQRDQKALLEREKSKRATLVAQLSSRLGAQRKEAGAVERDEQRLGGLVDQLAKMIEEQRRAEIAAENRRRELAAAAERARAEKLRQQQLARKKQQEQQAQNAAKGRPAPRVDPADAIDADENPNTATAKAEPAPPPKPAIFPSSFPALRGQLQMPVHGELAARFGANRGDGPSWKGLFIRAPEGAEIKAVAGGRVVFAEWLRGFGNLIIVDHGGQYMSIYGNNQSLLKRPGDAVKSGDVIASAGNSGGNEQSGLYFEMRHQGRAFDPLGWVTSR